MTIIKEKEITVKIVLCSPDDVNEYARNKGVNVQAVALTDNLANIVLVSYPPIEMYNSKGERNPDFSYGMSKHDLIYALGFELWNNICKFDIDPSGINIGK